MTPGHSIRGLLLVVACAAGAMQAHAVDVDWVTVGDPGNACDLQSQGCFGAVPYRYQISRTEVTNARYAAFLNAVDPAGANGLGLYNPNMGSDATFGGISFAPGNPDGSKYVVKAGFATKPVVYVNVIDALRFANWMHNGQGGGSTEDGAYTLLGGTPFPSNWTTVTRNPEAKIFLTSEDEWYKAAYYDASSLGYDPYPFADGFDGAVCELPPGTTGHSVNCWPATSPSGALSDVGAYTISPSAYGTFDQAGNVSEWNEAIIDDGDRGLRGGSWISNQTFELAASYRGQRWPGTQFYEVGFRVAACSGPCIHPACSDELDNDGDGAIDFPADPGCSDPDSPRENPECQEGTDNDADGRIDFDGGSNAGVPAPLRTAPDADCAAGWDNREAPDPTAPPTFVGLGFLPGCDTSVANSVSAQGAVVVGTARSDEQTGALCGAFRWTAADGMVGLGDLPGGPFDSHASGVSDDGSVVVGTSRTDTPDATRQEGFHWTQAGGMVGLGFVPGSNLEDSVANAVSADGSVLVGRAGLFATVLYEAYRWTAGTGLVRIGQLPGGRESFAESVSADGATVVGTARNATGRQEAFRWTAASGMAGLGVLPGMDRSYASDISAFGSVIVGDLTSDLQPGVRGFRWTSQDGMVDLGSLPGATLTFVRSLSGDGSMIVGQSGAPFLWDATHGMRPLVDVLVGDYAIHLGGWTELIPNAISDDGRAIVGVGTNPNGRPEAWLVILPDGPSCSDGIDNDGDGRVDLADPGCESADDLAEKTPSLICDDGVDNDGDGSVDLADPGCDDVDDPSEQSASLICDDGVDNDGDGPADLADPGCTEPDDGSEVGECQNGIDDDGDGLVDLDDGGCEDATDAHEYVHAACGDGFDNDGDGLQDFPADPGCRSAASSLEDPRCQDGIDNDGRTGIDFDGGASANGGTPLDVRDPDCNRAWQTWEGPSYCGLGFEIALLMAPLLWLRQRRRLRSRQR